MPNKIVSSNDDVTRGTHRFLSMEDGKTLSKNLMYAPLVAYHKSARSAGDHQSSSTSSASKTNHPSQYMSDRNSVSKALSEPSLVSILRFVSCDYHRNGAGVHGAKNNGSRPLGTPDVEDRIRQRAVTLLGGGINKSIPVVKRPIRSKKRRHRSWEEVEPILKKLSSLDEVTLKSESNHDTEIAFLQKLNSAWNEYVWKILMNCEDENQKQRMSHNLKEIEARLGVLVRRVDERKKHNKTTRHGARSSSFIEKDDAEDDRIDLIGAHLKIESSDSHKSWAGRFGVLIGETSNTYRIASFARRPKKKKVNRKESSQRQKQNGSKVQFRSKLQKPSGLGSKENTIDSVQKGTNTTQPDISINEPSAANVEILVLPKLGSSLQLILPLMLNESDQVDLIEDQKVNPEGITPESMIAIPHEAIGICVANQKHIM